MKKIVINIPDGLMNTIKNIEDDRNLTRDQLLTFYRGFVGSLTNGVVLPANHDRLILVDIDKLPITSITTDDYSGNETLDVILKEDLLSEAISLSKA